MRLKTRPAVVVPEQRTPAPQYALREDGAVSDLVCALCTRVIAYGVPTVRAHDEAPFYLELHATGCLRVHA